MSFLLLYFGRTFRGEGNHSNIISITQKLNYLAIHKCNATLTQKLKKKKRKKKYILNSLLYFQFGPFIVVVLRWFWNPVSPAGRPLSSTANETAVTHIWESPFLFTGLLGIIIVIIFRFDEITKKEKEQIWNE